MNKHQKALDYLVSDGTHQTLYSWGDEIEVETEHGVESLNLLQELVDKETPMKPYKDGKKYKCNRCKLQRVSSRYCRDCGQKLDWSDIE